MAQLLNVLLLLVAVLAKSEALGRNEERLERLQEKQNQRSQQHPTYNENLDQLLALLKTDTLKAVCKSEKVNPIWCQYKQLLELNSAYEKHEKLVKKKSSGSLCWPGIPLPCGGLVPARNVRAAVESEENYDAARNNANDSEYDYDTEEVDDISADTENDTDNYADSDNEKRAMKCRPGMVNCRRKKKGKRTMAITKPKDCPQGWMFCL